jgi:two-component system, NtrC family, sensor histidine kinase GlrK
MRLTIFPRLLSGYILVLILLSATSGFALFRLHQFEEVTRTLLQVDSQRVETGRKMVDAILSEVRYERKYAIVHDKRFHDQYLLARTDFQNQLGRLEQVTSSFPSDNLAKIKSLHREYQVLVAEEKEHIDASRPYSQTRLRQEKENRTERLLEEMDALIIRSEQNIYAQIQGLGETASRTRQGVVLMILVTLLIILAVSFFLTRSITKPLGSLMARIREIPRGVCRGNLHPSSPPEMHRLYEELSSMHVQLETMERMKADFFSMMSHELRTPLTAIKEGTSLLAEQLGEKATAKEKKLLRIIADECQRLIELVNTSLDFSKMEADMMPYHFTPAHLGPLIQKAAAEIKPLAMAKRVHLQVAERPNLPLAYLDRERILQAVRNLIGNAVKFTPEGGVVTVTAANRDGTLEVCVRDTGPGLAPEYLADIFEKYRQGPHPGKGTGLGLAIVKHVITAHGGKVWAESAPGQGSSFCFVLPA